QAEDGIRDRNVTGVQTCALPIWRGAIVAGTAAQARRPSGAFTADRAARAGGRGRRPRGDPVLRLDAGRGAGAGGPERGDPVVRADRKSVGEGEGEEGTRGATRVG